jgi:hypothetical protein
MIKRVFFLLKDRAKGLANTKLHWLIGLIATVQQSIKHRAFVKIARDRSGYWKNARREAIFVAPELHALSYKEVEEAVIDQWCYACDLTEGDVVIDVGAGIGDDVLVFSRMVGPGRIGALGCAITCTAPRKLRGTWLL